MYKNRRNKRSNRRTKVTGELTIKNRRRPASNSSTLRRIERAVMNQGCRDRSRSTKKKTGPAVAVKKKNTSKLPKMHPNTALWCAAYSDPFRKMDVRMPAAPVMASQAVTITAQGSSVSNAAGFGFITVNPANFSSSDIHSVSTSNLTTGSTMGGGTTSNFMSNSPYISTDYTLDTVPRKQYRIAALGVRIKYTGTELNLSGTAYSIELEPKTNEATLDSFTITDVTNQNLWKEEAFGRKFFCVNRTIQLAQDKEYQGFDPTLGTGAFTYAANPTVPSTDTQFNIGICFQCTTSTTGEPFEWEVQGKFEIIGPRVPNTTVVPTDTNMVERAVGAIKHLRQQDVVTPDHTVDKKPQSKGGILGILSEVGSLVFDAAETFAFF